MDADALRMLADLGIDRRDVVSAPAEVSKGRNYREDPRELAAIAAEFEARRKHHGGDDVKSGGDERAARLRAWNMEATFETDEVASQLENRWSGQGHRAGLNNRHLNHDDPWESVDARFGEERRLYLQEKGGHHFSSHASSRPVGSGQDRFRDHILNGKASPPHKFSNGRAKDGRRAAPTPRAPEHARAPSPRRFGTVCFGPGSHRTQDSTGGGRTVSNAGLEAAAALRASFINGGPVQQSTPSSKVGSQDNTAGSPAMSNPGLQAATALRTTAVNGNHTLQSIQTPTKAAPSTGSHAISNGGLQAAAALRAMAAIAASRSRAQQADASSSEQGASSTLEEPVVSLEEAKGAEPLTGGSNGLLTSASHVMDTASRANNKNGAGAAQPVQGKPSTAASKDTTRRTMTPCSSNPPQDTASPEVCHNQALWWAANPGKECDDHFAKYPHRLKYLGPARDQLIREATGLVKLNNEIETMRYLETHPERKWMIDATKKAKMQSEEDTDEEIREYCAAHQRQKLFIRAAMAVFTPNREDMFAQPKAPTEQSTQPITTAPLKTTSAEAQRSSSDTSPNSSGRSSDTEDTADTAASSPPRSKLGILTAVFYDIADKFLGIHQVRVNAPVRAEIILTSRAKHYNPRELISSIETLAQSMLDRTHGLEGVRLADDGLWVDEEL